MKVLKSCVPQLLTVIDVAIMPAGGTGRNAPKLIKVLHMYVKASPLHKQK
jgi:hypothetical protein